MRVIVWPCIDNNFPFRVCFFVLPTLSPSIDFSFAADDAGAVEVKSELAILIRKQLSSPQLKYKKVGLMGTVAILSVLGGAGKKGTSSQNTFGL
jgi:hypothetical protein